MLFPKSLLFTIASGHMGVVTALLLYSVITLMKVQHGHVNAQQGCLTLNALLSFVVIIHGSSAFLLALHGHWALFALDYVIIHMKAHEILRNGKEGVYDAKTILNGGQIFTLIRKNYVYFMYFTICLSVYVKRISEGFNTPIDWNVFDPLKAWLFLPAMLLTEAVLCIQAYTIIAHLNIELDNSCARNICQKLNELVFRKTISYAILSYISLAHNSWAFFILNLQTLRSELCQIADARESKSDVYNPEKILRLGEIRKHTDYYKTCFLYSCVSFAIYMYRMFVGNIGLMAYIVFGFFPMVAMKICEISNVKGCIASILRLLNSREFGVRFVTWAYFVMYLLEWSITFVYCAYLFIWLEIWTVEKDGDWVLNMIVDMIYDFYLMAF